MVPLYAARVRDLGPGDAVVFKCGACGHTAELPPSGLLHGLGLRAPFKTPSDRSQALDFRGDAEVLSGALKYRPSAGIYAIR
jgi:hypothetical protein